MKVLAADRYIPCRGLVRTLQLLQKDVFVTAADSIDEILARIPGLPDVDLVLLDATMPAMENFVGLRRVVEKLPDVVVTAPSESRAKSSPPFVMAKVAISLFRRRRPCSGMFCPVSCREKSTSRLVRSASTKDMQCGHRRG
jgi:CheY-like chemotaxis protein